MPRLDMPARWPRSLLAMAFVATAGGFGMAALAAGPAQAANDTPACGTLQVPYCPPQAPLITATTTESGGTITITWTAVGSGVAPDPSPPTIMWTPPVTPPAQAPKPASGAITLDGGMCQGTTTDVCTYPWPAALIANSSGNMVILNGSYTVSASATDCFLALVNACSKATTGSTPVNVDNGAAKPTGVTAVVQNPPSTVKVTWTPDSEPDLTGYQVFRSGDTTAVCTLSMFPPPTDYSCIDSPTADGSYSYQVVAYRWPPNYSTKIADQPASPDSAATKPVAVSGTAANTTTTTAPSGTTQTLGPSGFVAKPSPGKGGKVTLHATPAPAAAAASNADGAGGGSGFNPVLPYGQPTTTVGGNDPAALSTPPIVHKGKTSVGTIAVIGAGLLIGVIALHGLWLRSEVRRGGALEALDPEA